MVRQQVFSPACTQHRSRTAPLRASIALAVCMSITGCWHRDDYGLSYADRLRARSDDSTGRCGGNDSTWRFEPIVRSLAVPLDELIQFPGHDADETVLHQLFDKPARLTWSHAVADANVGGFVEGKDTQAVQAQQGR